MVLSCWGSGGWASPLRNENLYSVGEMGLDHSEWLHRGRGVVRERNVHNSDEYGIWLSCLSSCKISL